MQSAALSAHAVVFLLIGAIAAIVIAIAKVRRRNTNVRTGTSLFDTTTDYRQAGTGDIVLVGYQIVVTVILTIAQFRLIDALAAGAFEQSDPAFASERKWNQSRRRSSALLLTLCSGRWRVCGREAADWSERWYGTYASGLFVAVIAAIVDTIAYFSLFDTSRTIDAAEETWWTSASRAEGGHFVGTIDAVADAVAGLRKLNAFAGTAAKHRKGRAAVAVIRIAQARCRNSGRWRQRALSTITSRDYVARVAKAFRSDST